MFHLGAMNQKVANFYESVVTTPKVNTIFYRNNNIMHFLQFVSMKTTGAISLKIWNQTDWMMGLNVK